MKAQKIVELLRQRHREDIVVPECKTGSSTWDKNCRRFDVLVIPRSWINFAVIGYEIKTSRQDFTRDKKWRDYLPFCNQFYFVCPWGLIRPEEVTEGAGLLYVTKSLGRTYTTICASSRKIQDISSLLIYILIARSVIVDPPVHNELRIRGHDARVLLREWQDHDKTITEMQKRIWDLRGDLSDAEEKIWRLKREQEGREQ